MTGTSVMGQSERICFEIVDLQDGNLEAMSVEVKLPDDYETRTVAYMMQVASRNAMKDQFMRVCVKRIGQEPVDWIGTIRANCGTNYTLPSGID